ncbi:MAG: bifunctional phosphopantothenoylcysteine decarboxylase/phosphopantothenate--cysteine ligase CoaBC [Bacillota bacterium]
MAAAHKTVVLGVTGGIAAYKACELISRLTKKGIEVYPVMTKSATRFITPLTLRTLCARPVAVDLFSDDAPFEVEHISLARRADVLAIVPATANIIGKLALGIADDLLSTTAMATRAPVLIAPAMNSAMLESAAVQDNLQTLRARGCTIVEAESGRLACGEEGAGRLADIGAIEAAIDVLLYPKQDLQGLNVLVTAGPTREFIDPVRYITNRSSGRMGYALAQAARERGAEVVLISGPVSIDAPDGVTVVRVQTAAEMLEAALGHFEACDIAIKAAAPADYAPKTRAEHKLKKTGQSGEETTLTLIPNTDIAAELGRRKGNRVLVGFAAETQALEQNAVEKLQKKNLDMIVANDVTLEGAGFEGQTNIVTMITADGEKVNTGLASKTDISHRILDAALSIYRRKQE